MENIFKFEDWINDQDLTKKDWIIVAQYGGSSKNESFFTQSVIVDLHRMSTYNTEDVDKIEKLIFIPERKWELGFLKKVDQSEVLSQIFSDYYIPNNVIDVGDIKSELTSDYEIENFADYHIINSLIVRPFVYMLENRRLGIRYELDQKFPLFYEAQRRNDEYLCMDGNGDIITVAKIEQDKNGWVKCYVLASYLRDYLTLTGYGLWRYHTHYRHGQPNKEDLGEFEYHNKTFRCKLFITEKQKYDLGKWNIVLRGHDILLPYDKSSYEPLSTRYHNHYETFLIGIDEKGNGITHSCKVDQSKFFTPVYFRIDLMKHFYDNPEKYTVHPTFISADSLFAIDYGIVDDKVQVYLGDLSRLPYKEQKLWKSFNISLREKIIPEDRIRRDFYSQFAEPENIVENLRQSKENLNNFFEKKHRFKLFKDLNHPDEYREKIIHIPLTEDWKEFNSVLESLSIVYVESINNEVKKLLQAKISNETLKGKKSIKILQEFLKIMESDDQIILNIIKPFELLHRLRSEFASHRSSSEYKKSLEMLGLNPAQKKSSIIKSLIINLVDRLQTIQVIVEKNKKS